MTNRNDPVSLAAERLARMRPGDFERELLRVGRADAPRPGARRKTLIGLAGGAGALATATVASASVAKWIALGAFVSAIAVGGLVAAPRILDATAPSPARATSSAANATPQPAAPAAPTEPTAASPAPSAPTAAPVESAAPFADRPPTEEVAQPAAPPALATAAAPTSLARALAAPVRSHAPAAVGSSSAPVRASIDAPPPASAGQAPAASRVASVVSLGDEVRSLDAARAAVRADRKAEALRALDEHDRRFPGGALGPEAMVLRIEALARASDRASAARIGEAFLAAHADSPLAPRVRALLHGE